MKNLQKLPLWPALINAKCPRCRRGDMFQNRMYGFSSQVMIKKCSHCDLVYEIEPGYFYVAMLISYAMNVAEIVSASVATYVLTESINPWVYVAITIILALILSPFNFRYSRIVLLYWLTPGINYQPELSKDHEMPLQGFDC
ncbi:DUF983 domain-containing protein [Mucilaginibacter aquariorum]|uniref:DUF983 domain-containing protein n=1 Tax=Mucilaginibacter aquariorum TaxID=2967225 RepID=A0ABT1SXD3_9SPHI|nr:DUF983 domain-containing protein [Mucilaginibacter aquariorum]MCQ6957017.1 DUF983 domain-containing protein [Mucilaginibacter aquariorum]